MHRLSRWRLICISLLCALSFAACDSDAGDSDATDSTSGATGLDTSGNTSGTTGTDTSGTIENDTSGGTSGSTSGDTSGLTNDDTSGSTSGTTNDDTSGPDTSDVIDPPDGWPDGVVILTLDANGEASATTSFSASTLATVSTDWGLSPEVGCWDDSLEGEFFSKNMLLFALSEPLDPWTEVTITARPSATTAETNPLALQLSADQFVIPPALSSATFCHQNYVHSPGVAQQHTFTVLADAPQNMLFAVANRGRFSQDDSGDVLFEVSTRAIPPAGRCFGEITKPGQWPASVTQLALDAEGEVAAADTFGPDAQPVCDLSFAASSQLNCFPAPQFGNFDGLQRFYALAQPLTPEQWVTVTITPNPSVDVNLYGALMGEGNYYVPSNFPSALACDASHSYSTPNPGESESLSFWTGSGSGNFELFFAVSSPDLDVRDQGYTVSIDSISTSTNTCTDADYNPVLGLTDWPASVEQLTLTAQNRRRLPDEDITTGAAQCTLDWASSSQNSCFPETDFDYFGGHHKFYALDVPPPAGSYVRWTVTPHDGVDVNVYGYRLGTNNFLVPPHVPSSGQCEAAYGTNLVHAPNPGEPEVIEFYNPGGNSYQYFLGVASRAPGELEGLYDVEVEVEIPPPPHCPESLPGATYPTWPTVVEQIEMDTQGSATTTGNLSSGACVNLSFADDSAVACFPATEFSNFEGSHVFYALSEPMPPRSELTIRARSTDGGDINVYGLQVGASNYPVPPAVLSAVACEASYNQSGSGDEVLFFSNPSESNSYNVFFAVAGESGDAAGAFEIDLDLAVAVPHCPESLPGPTGLSDWPNQVTTLALDAEGEATATGNLSSGACSSLGFAAESDVACFPATQFAPYAGNHVFYALEQPIPPGSYVTISAHATDGGDISLYGLQMGATTYQVPPAVTSAISCEASAHEVNGGDEVISFYNPSSTSSYNVMFGVAGALGDAAGAFEVHAHLVEGQTQCPESLPGASYTAWPASVRQVRANTGTPQVINDNLTQGACVNLGFASDSNVACFPETLADDFTGNQVFYALDEPLQPGETLTVLVEQTGATPVKVYGYSIGTGSFYVPPFVPVAVACEYSVQASGQPQSISFVSTTNPYNVFFAVAGEGAAAVSGGYRLTVTRQ